MPKSSSLPSPTIAPMNPSSIHQTQTLPPPSPPSHPDLGDDFLPHALLMDEDDDDDEAPHQPPSPSPQQPLSPLLFPHLSPPPSAETLIGDRKSSSSSLSLVDPAPHISSQFYTFNRDSHSLMVRCILESRVATPDEIRAATPAPVLASWRAVWKDRNEDTAYLTAWKRIQDKLAASADSAEPALFFKTNPAQRVSHVEQWQAIAAAAHADPDLLRHLGLKDTLDRIKQSWTVGAKFYGIPEAFIRACISSCPVCNSSSLSGGAVSSGGRGKAKRRRFEYTETLNVPARDVPRCLQQLAAKHKVVLCIRQKYIRYKPFMAEVKDYACHRAGEPTSAPSSSMSAGKKSRFLKREPYQSKRCGCGFRIRAIVPITNYNEKDKTFVYQEEGTAVFKLYAVHSGHEPGPLDGNARIVHRLVGQKGAVEFDPEIYGISEDNEPSYVGDVHHMVLQQVQEVRVEVGMLEANMSKMPSEMLGLLSRELSDVLQRIRKFSLDEGVYQSDDALLVGNEVVVPWGSEHNHHLGPHDGAFCKDDDMIEEDEPNFGATLGPILSWDRMTTECQDRKMLVGDSLKTEKWMIKEDVGDFVEKSILNCDHEEDEDSKLNKSLTHNEMVMPDSNLVGMQVDGFYPGAKWYDSPGGLDSGGDTGDAGFRHGEIM